ncbi:DUF624 domain-containing protein [Arthrobacter sp. ISL-30]|uniref:DUF624 domain-containing protein n=1 Tax=Arthrobacter sp. ISL-30 TaxID=2819109 RepID=UPI001BE8387A|nr:DUF624 domain-containing protein [Arthrobacter sp. ISL-30]MBT2513438.1 DUF624 domain-containing protein [Arthrobacter sp. ISL-30]
MVQKKAEYGSGPLFKAAGVVYGVVMGDALLVLANVLLVLSPVLMSVANVGGAAGSVAGIVLVLVAFALLGPSLTAAMYAFNRLLLGHETGVSLDFLRGYRENFRPALAVWLPYLVLLAVVVFNLALLPATIDPGNPAGSAVRIGLLVLGLMVCTAGVTALLLLSRFTFRTRDLLRISLFCLGAQKRVSVGNAGILFVTAFLLTVTSVFLILFIAGPMVYLICLNSRPLLRVVEEKFTVTVG